MYEYECGNCHRRVEKIQSFSAEPLRECGFCGGPLERLISAPAIQFKGSGWYVTDYAKKNSAAPAAASSEAKASGDKAGESKPGESAAKSETKSETTSDAGTPSTASPAPAKADSKP